MTNILVGDHLGAPKRQFADRFQGALKAVDARICIKGNVIKARAQQGLIHSGFMSSVVVSIPLENGDSRTEKFAISLESTLHPLH
jgi:hypothetical protein